MEPNYKMYHNLMPHRIREILIVSSPYDAFIMEEDGGIIENVFHRFRGVSLVEPPQFTVARSTQEAMEHLQRQTFDLVITMPKVLGPETIAFGKEVRQIDRRVPLVLLSPTKKGLNRLSNKLAPGIIDKIFVWSGNRTILWAIIKWAEDRMNVTHDTNMAGVRVLILIEDSPHYYSSFLPNLYRSVLKQTQAVIDDTLNEEHRLLKLRARTKILLASSYEEGMDLYFKYKPYLLGIFSDIRFPKNGVLDGESGISFLTKVKYEQPELPTLLLSTEATNQQKAWSIGAQFLDKNDPALQLKIRQFLVDYMGFGDFVFKLPNGETVARAANLKELESVLDIIPEESLKYHVGLNHFSNWLMARSEISLALQFREQKYSDFPSDLAMRSYLKEHIKDLRKRRLKGTIAQFNRENPLLDAPFLKIGNGSLGGKARGLAFMAKFLDDNSDAFKGFEGIEVSIPQTLVLTTDCYDDFIVYNQLENYFNQNHDNQQVDEIFSKSKLPQDLEKDLRAFLQKVTTPIAVRSSSLLEDSYDEPYAGLYATYMLPNNHPEIDERLRQLSLAVRLVYASVFHEGPKAYSKTTQHRTEEEKMAVVIQKIIGSQWGDYFYPPLSGTAQSRNFYPVDHVKADDGSAYIAVGLGKIIVEGGQALRFCPRYPQHLPQFSKVDEMLLNSQKSFFALDMQINHQRPDSWKDENANLVRREIYSAKNEWPIRLMSSTYYPNDNMIRDGADSEGSPVISFANLLKYERIPLTKVINKMLEISKVGFGCDMEMEFAVNIHPQGKEAAQFILLQARPMLAPTEDMDVKISAEQIEQALCYSTSALGRGINSEIQDLVVVKHEGFSFKNTIETVAEISKFNQKIGSTNSKFLLVGPGRWGSADFTLGIPVQWSDISNVGAIIEAKSETLRADPSQGTHFFQNITSLGIVYMTIHSAEDKIQWDWFKQQTIIEETKHLMHIKLASPLTIIIDGKSNTGVILDNP